MIEINMVIGVKDVARSLIQYMDIMGKEFSNLSVSKRVIPFDYVQVYIYRNLRYLLASHAEILMEESSQNPRSSQMCICQLRGY